MAVDFGYKIFNLAVAHQHRMELSAAARLDIPRLVAVEDAGEHLLFARIAVQKHQRPVALDVAAIRQRPINAFRKIFDEVGIVFLLAQRLQVKPAIANGPDRNERRQNDICGEQPVLASLYVEQ